MSVIERIKKERADLALNLEELTSFIMEQDGVFDSLTKGEKVAMIKQLAAMESYLEALDSRIWIFENK